MTKRQRELEHLRTTNPYVIVWREVDKNDFTTAMERLNEKWDTGGMPLPCERMASTVEYYLSRLRSYVNYVMGTQGMVDRDIKFYMDKFGLNLTEARYLRNH